MCCEPPGARHLYSGGRRERVQWERRRDLEGGKELGVWLLVDGDAVERELYVESHEYRGGAFDVYTATPDGEWHHEGTFETVTGAFDAAEAYLDESEFPQRVRS
jgi:hypothetical protein